VIVYAIGIFGLAQWVSREKAGHAKDTSDYFLASKSLPWWAIGASLIAANISAEQIVGMAGSGYAIGLAIASYEWMAALTLLIVGKFFLPIFLKNEIYTMPQFLEQRFGRVLPVLMAVFWLALYVFVNLTSIIWLGSIAVNKVAGVDQTAALIARRLRLALSALWRPQGGGADRHRPGDPARARRPRSSRISRSTRSAAIRACSPASHVLTERAPSHFDMILKPGQSLLQGSAGHRGAGRRHVDRQPQLLGLQPVYHPARAGREEPRRGAEGRGVRRVPQAADAGDHRAAGHRRSGARARPGQARRSLSDDDEAAAPGPARPGLRGADRGDHRVDRVQDQFDRTIFTLDLYAKARGIKTRGEDNGVAGSRGRRSISSSSAASSPRSPW
jgi:SSS family solute:Na+ symporter